MLDLNDVALFVQVVRCGSFAEAARRLGLPANTVSRRVQQLEAQLGTRLMQRSTRKLTLTGAGQAFHERCVGAVDGLAEAGQELMSGSQEPSGLVRVAATVVGRLGPCGSRSPPGPTVAALGLAVAGQRDQQRVRDSAGLRSRAPPRSRSCPAGRCPAAPRRAGTRAPCQRRLAFVAIFTSKPSISSRVIRSRPKPPGRRPPGCARRPVLLRRDADPAPAASGARLRAHARRQADRHLRRPCPGPRWRLDVAAMQLDQVLDQRQADAQAALRAVQRLVGLREQVEHVRQEFGRDAGALVLDRDLQFAILEACLPAGCGCARARTCRRC
jgi:molybdenum-dependent DNA-binding transcriptional regulator ModE